jgi:hypothetical protein
VKVEKGEGDGQPPEAARRQCPVALVRKLRRRERRLEGAVVAPHLNLGEGEGQGEGEGESDGEGEGAVEGEGEG